MIARLIKLNDEIVLLLQDGSICKRERVALNTILKEFKYIDTISERDYEVDTEVWNISYNRMEDVEGVTIAYVNDDKELIIKDFAPFIKLFDYSDTNDMIQKQVSEHYMSLPEYAEYVGVNPARIKVLCSENRLPATVKIGRNWVFLLGKDTPYPEDQRMTNAGKKNRTWKK